MVLPEKFSSMISRANPEVIGHDNAAELLELDCFNGRSEKVLNHALATEPQPLYPFLRSSDYFNPEEDFWLIAKTPTKVDLLKKPHILQSLHATEIDFVAFKKSDYMGDVIRISDIKYPALISGSDLQKLPYPVKGKRKKREDRLGNVSITGLYSASMVAYFEGKTPSDSLFRDLSSAARFLGHHLKNYVEHC